MQKEAIQYLIEQYINGQLTEAQRQELLALSQAGKDEALAGVVKEFLEQASQDAGPVDIRVMQASLQQVLAVDKGVAASPTPVFRIAFLRHWWVAASILLLLLSGVYFWQNHHTKEIAKTTNSRPTENDVSPGGNKATLTLANGQQIILDSAHNGTLVQQGNANVQKMSNGQLAYQRIDEKPTVVLYNTLNTPRGGQYQLTLPDGTKVWLNAASSITYPTAFTGSERKVTISGEAYLEVAKEAAHPFIVRVQALGKGTNENGFFEDIQVLGTAFNVNAYDDEAFVRTTLLEGSIRVEAIGTKQIIQPGEQAAVTFGGQGIDVNPHANVEEAIAWKNGLFSFTKADLPMVMRQLARWYDVDVTYEGNMPKRSFNGEIGKMLTLDQLLKVLSTTTRVHYTIEGKKLTIQP
jgi:transmembrane sensor